MTYTIRHIDGRIICEGEADTFIQFLEQKIMEKVDLRGIKLLKALCAAKGRLLSL